VQGLFKDLCFTHKYGDHTKRKSSPKVKALFLKRKHQTVNPYNCLLWIRGALECVLPHIESEGSLKEFLEDMRNLTRQPSGEIVFPEEQGFENPECTIEERCKVQIHDLTNSLQVVNGQFGTAKKKSKTKSANGNSRWIVELDTAFKGNCIVEGCNVQIQGLTSELSQAGEGVFPLLAKPMAYYWRANDEAVTVGLNASGVWVAKFGNGDEQPIVYHDGTIVETSAVNIGAPSSAPEEMVQIDYEEGWYEMEMVDGAAWRFKVKSNNEFRVGGSPPEEIIWNHAPHGDGNGDTEVDRWTKTIDGACGMVTKKMNCQDAADKQSPSLWVVALDKPFTRCAQFRRDDLRFGDVEIDLFGKITAVSTEVAPALHEVRATSSYLKGRSWGFCFEGDGVDDLVIAKITKDSWVDQHTKLGEYLDWRIVSLNSTSVRNLDDIRGFDTGISLLTAYFVLEYLH
jgi:hypothetical protein